MSVPVLASFGLVLLFAAVVVECLSKLQNLRCHYHATPRDRLVAVLTGMAGVCGCIACGLQLQQALA